jgi:hypothetical protein
MGFSGVFNCLWEAFDYNTGTEKPDFIKAETIDDIINNRPAFAPNLKYADRVPKEFLNLYLKHKDKIYLSVIASAILKDLGKGDTEQSNHNVQGWVYGLGEDERVGRMQGEHKVSEELKAKIASGYVGKKVAITLSSEGSIFGSSGAKVFQVRKDGAGKVYLLIPRSNNKGWMLDDPELIITKLEEV